MPTAVAGNRNIRPRFFFFFLLSLSLFSNDRRRSGRKQNEIFVRFCGFARPRHSTIRRRPDRTRAITNRVSCRIKRDRNVLNGCFGFYKICFDKKEIIVLMAKESCRLRWTFNNNNIYTAEKQLGII